MMQGKQASPGPSAGHSGPAGTVPDRPWWLMLSLLLLCSLLLRPDSASAQRSPLPADGPAPVLVELFTSQGCSSCPPADQALADLGQEADIVALSFHVDYWDYIGWKDPFARPDFTKRQKWYADRMNLRMVYTPQMVIHGQREVVGSRQQQVQASLNAARQEAGASPVRLSLARESGSYRIEIAEQDPPGQSGAATLYVAWYDEREKTRVTEGENRGKTLLNTHIVREIRPVAHWEGGNRSFSVPPAPSGSNNLRLAAFLQQENGTVLAAGQSR